jgi:hypothetical protein
MTDVKEGAAFPLPCRLPAQAESNSSEREGRDAVMAATRLVEAMADLDGAGRVGAAQAPWRRPPCTTADAPGCSADGDLRAELAEKLVQPVDQ